jgi:hypothetical protein
MLATPKAFIATLAGLALRALERAFAVSFKGGFTLGPGLLPGDGGECAHSLDRGAILGRAIGLAVSGH